MSVSFSAASRTSAAPLPTTDVRSGGPTSAELLDFVTRVAADSALIARLPLPEQGRTWMRLEGPDGSEAWLIGWPPGAETGWHDHGGSRGAFATAAGELAEESVAVPLPAYGWRSLELADGVDRTRAPARGQRPRLRRAPRAPGRQRAPQDHARRLRPRLLSAAAADAPLQQAGPHPPSRPRRASGGVVTTATGTAADRRRGVDDLLAAVRTRLTG